MFLSHSPVHPLWEQPSQRRPGSQLENQIKHPIANSKAYAFRRRTFSKEDSDEEREREGDIKRQRIKRKETIRRPLSASVFVSGKKETTLRGGRCWKFRYYWITAFTLIIQNASNQERSAWNKANEKSVSLTIHCIRFWEQAPLLRSEKRGELILEEGT